MIAADARTLVEDALREHPEAIVPTTLVASPVEHGFVVRGEGVELAVDGATGALTGSAKVEPVAARARVLTLMCFAVAAAWAGSRLFEVGALLIALPLRALAAQRLVNATFAAGLTLVGTLWLAVRFSGWVATLRPELLDEPVATAAEGIARWPAPKGVEELLRRASLLMVPAIVVAALAALTAWELGASLGAWLALLTLVPLALIVVEAHGVKLPSGPQPVERSQAGGSWGEFVTTGLLGSRLALGVMLFAIGAKASGLFDSLATLSATRVPMWSELLDTALQASVIAAVLVGKPSHGRRAAALSLFGGLVGERLAGQPGKLVVTALVLFVTLRAAHRSTPDSLRLTAVFELQLALGRILGRVLAGGLLGPLAISLGEALGEQFVALTTSARLEPLEVGPRTEPRLLSTRGVRAAGLLTLGLAGVLIVAPWRTQGRDAPADWNTVTGAGWSAQMPGHPVRQTSQAQLLRVGAAVPLHHYTSAWKGSLFVVLELEWPATAPELDADGFLTVNQLLPFQHLNVCQGLMIGVTRENSVRCLTSATPERLAIGCVLSEPLGQRFVDGEVAFLSSLRAGEKTFEGGARGLSHPEECVLDPKVIREMGRLSK